MGSVGTRFPMVRIVTRSPTPLLVSRLGITRESTQVRNATSGVWPPATSS